MNKRKTSCCGNAARPSTDALFQLYVFRVIDLIEWIELIEYSAHTLELIEYSAHTLVVIELIELIERIE